MSGIGIFADLAQINNKSSKDTKLKSDTASEALFEAEEAEVVGWIIQDFFNSGYIFNVFPEICQTNPFIYQQKLHLQPQFLLNSLINKF